MRRVIGAVLAGLTAAGCVPAAKRIPPAGAPLTAVQDSVVRSMIATTYDPYADHTTRATRELSLYIDAVKYRGVGDVAVYFYIQAPGHAVPVLPDSVTVVLRSTSRTWQYLYDNGLVFLADSTRVPVQIAAKRNQVSDPITSTSVRVSETLGGRISWPEFLALANAHGNIPGRIGTTEFFLPSTYTHVLQEFARQSLARTP